jgi:hypothetical protein
LLLADVEGYFIENVAFAGNGAGALDITLQDRPLRPGIIISTAGVRSFSIENTDGLDASFVDELHIDYIPGDSLARIRIVGPTMVEAVVAILQVFVEAV